MQPNLISASNIATLIMAFELDGNPVTQGSKKAFVNPKTGRPIIVEDRSRDLDLWRGRVTETASKLMRDRPLYREAMLIEMRFTLPRPQSLARRPMALPVTNPDLDKLVRACGDALSKIVYFDDKQTCDLIVSKRYEGHPEARPRPGVAVTIYGYDL